jgi:hypothetical protein
MVLSEPQQLQAERFRIRRRINTQTTVVGVVLLAAFFGVWFAIGRAFAIRHPSGGFASRLPDWVSLVVVTVVFGVGGVLLWWSAARLRKAEERLAKTVPRRIAHSERRSVRTVAGTWHVIASVIGHAAGIGIGLGIGLFSELGASRAIGFIYLAGTVLLGLVSLALTRQALTRPALATDELSLVTDDRFRRKDVQRTLQPFASYIAIPLIGSLEPLSSAIVALYVLLVVLLYSIATLVHRDRTPPQQSAQSPLGSQRRALTAYDGSGAQT